MLGVFRAVGVAGRSNKRGRREAGPVLVPPSLREPQLPPPMQVATFFGVQTSRPV